jgi:hypothetical protein
MTAPVLVRIKAGLGPECGDDFTISFYLPPPIADSAPEPTSEDVFIEQKEAMTFAVRPFGGWMTERKIQTEAHALEEALEANGMEIGDDAELYTAAYDPPFRIKNRHNEVWLEVTDAKQKQTQVEY